MAGTGAHQSDLRRRFSSFWNRRHKNIPTELTWKFVGTRSQQRCPTLHRRIAPMTKEHYDRAVRKSVTDHTNQKKKYDSGKDRRRKHSSHRNEMTQKGAMRRHESVWRKKVEKHASLIRYQGVHKDVQKNGPRKYHCPHKARNTRFVGVSCKFVCLRRVRRMRDFLLQTKCGSLPVHAQHRLRRVESPTLKLSVSPLSLTRKKKKNL